MSVMNAIKQAQVQNRKYHTIYLIAVNVYQHNEASNPPGWYRAWLDEIKQSIEAGEKMYVRPRKYDRLLSLLFPEMRKGLSKVFGTEDYVPNRGEHYLLGDRDTTARPSEFSPRTVPNTKDPYWLKGWELEQWKRTHPTEARNFFGNAGEKRDDA